MGSHFLAEDTLSSSGRWTAGESIRRVSDGKAAGERKGMKIKNVVLNLSSEETMRLTRILLDEDKDEALAFLKECLKSQLAEATRDH